MLPKMSSTIFQFQKKVFDINTDIKNKIVPCVGRQNECFCNCSFWKENWNTLVLDGVVLLGSDMLWF